MTGLAGGGGAEPFKLARAFVGSAEQDRGMKLIMVLLSSVVPIRGLVRERRGVEKEGVRESVFLVIAHTEVHTSHSFGG